MSNLSIYLSICTQAARVFQGSETVVLVSAHDEVLTDVFVEDAMSLIQKVFACEAEYLQ
jgi:hypothetical protein